MVPAMAGWAEPTRETYDPLLDVLPGWGFQPAFGQRFNVPNNTTADIWAGTSLIRPLPLAPKGMSLVSSSAADGATKLAAITFIDEAGDWRASDLRPLNGITPVPITYKPDDRLVTQGATPSPPDGTSVAASIFRIQEIVILVAAGSTEAVPRVVNTGTVRAVDTATGLITYDAIAPGLNRSSSSAFHCPSGFEARLTRVHTGIVRGQGRVNIATTFGLGTAWQVLPLVPINDGALVFLNDAATTPISERADIQAVVIAGANNIDVSCLLQVRLKELA